MDLAVGAIVEGKVTGITKFGAFVGNDSLLSRDASGRDDPC